MTQYDEELEHLKSMKNQAHQLKMESLQKMEEAWAKITPARDAMNQLFDAKTVAYADRQRTWDVYLAVKLANTEPIQSLKERRARAYHNMVRSFSLTTEASVDGEVSSLVNQNTEGERFKAEKEACDLELFHLNEEKKSAWAAHQLAKATLEQAKEDFLSAQSVFNAAVAEHAQVVVEYREADANLASALRAYQSRLYELRTQNNKRYSEKHLIAAKAGIPNRYRSNVWIVRDESGTIDIYFGGMGTPQGPGRGRYSLDADGNVIFKRDPYNRRTKIDPADYQIDYEDLIVEKTASRDEFAFTCKYKGQDAYVESGINSRGRPEVYIYFGPEGPLRPGYHHVVVYRKSPFDIISDSLQRAS